MACGINWTLLKVAHSCRLSKSISAKFVRLLVSVLHRCCCWNNSSFDWCGESGEVVEENNKTRVGGDRHEVFSRETPHHCGKFRHHATVEGPQNWALVWGPGSRAPESKVLENSNTMQRVRSHRYFSVIFALLFAQFFALYFAIRKYLRLFLQ